MQGRMTLDAVPDIPMSGQSRSSVAESIVGLTDLAELAKKSKIDFEFDTDVKESSEPFEESGPNMSTSFDKYVYFLASHQ